MVMNFAVELLFLCFCLVFVKNDESADLQEGKTCVSFIQLGRIESLQDLLFNKLRYMDYHYYFEHLRL